MINITIPPVGESISEVVLTKWLKKTGDFVKRDEVIAEVESEKASFEISAEADGVLSTQAKEDQTLKVGDVIGMIDNKATAGKASVEKASAPVATKAAASSATGEVLKIVIPPVGESISEVTFRKWVKKSGDAVMRDEIIAEVESEKASFEINAEKSGILTTIAKEDQTLKVGDLIGEIKVGEVTSTAKSPAPAEKSPATSASSSQSKPVASATPLAKAIIEEKKIDIKQIHPTPPSQKITRKDILEQALQFQSSEGERTTNSQKLTSLRKTISRRLVEAKNTTAMLTTFNEVDMSAVMELRKTYKDSFKEKHGVGLGFMSFFTRACCLALQEVPAVNAYLNDDQIIYHNYCDVSIAVSTPKGLVVPVIRNAERMSMDEIEKEVILLANKARDGKLTMDDMQGGTFTITNGGVFGSLLSTPIINPPQSAILGMHKIEDRPVVINKKVEVRPMMYLALSYDHRIIDGKESVTFLVKVKHYLEHPALLIAGKDPSEILLGL